MQRSLHTLDGTLQKPARRNPTRAALAALALMAAGLVVCAGCSTGQSINLDDFDLIAVQEEMVEFPLGRYSIPIPITQRDEGATAPRRNRLELAFNLHAVVTSEQRAHLADSWGRHEGIMRFEVIRVCRNASLDDLQEKELTTLKSYLADALQAQIGAPGIRKLVITDVATQEL